MLSAVLCLAPELWVPIGARDPPDYSIHFMFYYPSPMHDSHYSTGPLLPVLHRADGARAQSARCRRAEEAPPPGQSMAIFNVLT